MCGITGIVGPDAAWSEGVLGEMLDSLAHRGPDGRGVGGTGGCRLGLRRLAIVGLDAPATPFASPDGSIACVTNGEIYNARALRAELEAKGHRFATGVDTEVVLHLWEELGPALVERLDGMFAFAVWDARRETLVLGRDRAGEKPLFYHHDGRRLVFGSELRAVLAHPEVPRRLEPRALVAYLAHGYCPAPLSPIAGIRKLPAGHLLIHHAGSPGTSETVRYWDLAEHFRPADAAARRPSDAALAAEVDGAIGRAVARRSRSDVPVGVFLSGGIDSATVLAHLVERQGPGVPAFTLGFDDPAFDESGHAAETARHLGAELHRRVVGRAELAEGLASLGRSMDEPLGDVSIVPTYLLSRFARERVKVVLSGEGADELFGGYPTYLGHPWADRFERLPRRLRDGLLGGARRLLPVSMGNVGPDYLLERFAAGLGRPPVERHLVWFGSLEPWRLGEVLSPALRESVGLEALAAPHLVPRPSRPLPDRLSELLYADFTTYLPEDLLTKIDRGTMLASLEARSVFLDHELAERVAGLPSRQKVRGRTTKAVLRRAVAHRLPPAVLARRKRGFNVPFSRWVLEGLGDDLRRRFSRERVETRGLFDAAGVERLLAEHLERRADHRKPLYGLLAFDLWCDRTFGDGAAVPWEEASETALPTPAVAGALGAARAS